MSDRPTAAGLTSVFVRNLPYDLSDADLEAHFADAGPVRSAFIVRDKQTKQGRGFGFVQFVLADDAQRAVELYHGKAFRKRNLSVEVAKKSADANASRPARGDKPKPRAPPASQRAGEAASSPSGGDGAAAAAAAAGGNKACLLYTSPSPRDS